MDMAPREMTYANDSIRPLNIGDSTPRPLRHSSRLGNAVEVVHRGNFDIRFPLRKYARRCMKNVWLVSRRDFAEESQSDIGRIDYSAEQSAPRRPPVNLRRPSLRQQR